MTTTIYGFVRDQDQAIAVLDDLLAEYFPEESISVLCLGKKVRRSTRPPSAAGAIQPLHWFPGLDLLIAPGIGAVIASGPVLSLLYAGRTSGIPALLEDLGVSPHRARLHGQRLRYGDLMIAVAVDDTAQADLVRSLLKDRGAEDVSTTVPSSIDHLTHTFA